jgi:hypothetical protein
MIQRFNFYDVYGYLLPGLVLAALLGVPFSLAGGLAPPAHFASAALAIILGYVLGHFVQRFADAWLPWTWWGVPRKRRLPSSNLLDPETPRLASEVKRQLAAKIQQRFHLDVGINSDDPEKFDPVRQEAFLQCRRDLLNSDRAAYAEQFQGMYSMMDGFACALGCAAAFYAGIASALEFAFPRDVERSIWALIVVWILVSIPSIPESGLTVWVERVVGVLVFWLLGMETAWYIGTKPHLARVALLTALGCVLLAFKSAKAFSYYAEIFAATVYRDFLVDKPEKSAKST